MSKYVRYCVVGYGNMGSVHSKNIHAGKVEGATLYAICDTDPEKIEQAKRLSKDIKLYSNHKEMLQDEAIDAVFVATPHYDHPVIAIDALRAGKHVLIEKPAGVYTKAVREMNDVAMASDRVFGIMYNQRTKSFYRKVKDLVDSGELGELRRVNWIITDWYRTQSYYNSGGWRATWAGEGGGVLLNQDPHQLDLLQWICGMPTRIRAFCSFGKMHDIEVEDDVTAYMEYENGATGVFITSTSDAPGTNRLEITGDRGKVVIENNDITFHRLRVSEREFNATNTSGFGEPECWKCEVPPAKKMVEDHIGILINFTNAILHGEELLAPGIEGINGLTISNAMHLSTWIDGWVTLPIDEDLYYEKLLERIRDSKFVKKTDKRSLDTEGTY